METIIGGKPAGAGGWIKDSDTAGFMADVIELSRTTPVIVDFWAPWCGPCKQLGPLLEKVVNAANGAVRMVKINVDENQELAQQMRIQSIPVVYGFKDGRPVDGFVGAQSESQIRGFVERLLGGAHVGPDPIDEALEQAKTALDAGDADTAAAIYGQVLSHDAANVKAIVGMARCRIASGDLEQGKKILESLPKEAANDPDAVAARAAIELGEKSKEAAGQQGELQARLQKDANDHQARFDNAMALYAQKKTEEAIDELLEIMRRKRDWNEQGARKQLVQIFEALGPTHPLTVAGRRRLSSILFS